MRRWYWILWGLLVGGVLAACQENSPQTQSHSSMSETAVAAPVSLSPILGTNVFPPFPESESANARQLTGSWNLVSFPITESKDTDSVLPTIPQTKTIWSWDSQQNQWLVYPKLEDFPLLETLHPEVGYWLMLNSQTSTELTGSGLEVPNYTVHSGWNLLGVSHSEDTLEIEAFLAQAHLWGTCPLDNAINSVWSWNNRSWQVYMPDPDGLNQLNTQNNTNFSALTTLEPGMGIWINAALANDETSCTVTEPDVCEADLAFFEQTVWTPILSGSCMACHAEGGFADQQGSRLVLRRDTQADYLNFNFTSTRTVADDIQNGTSLLLLKPTGQVSHGGGVQMQTTSSEYQALVTMVERFQTSTCGQNSDGGQTARAELPPVFDKVTVASYEETLRKAAMVLGGRLPTDTEIVQVRQNGETALSGILDQLMTEPNFYDHLKDIYNDFILTDRYIGYGAYVLSEEIYPNALWFQQYENDPELGERFWYYTNYGVGREPLELIAHVVRENRPFTEILTADYLMVSPYSARSYGITDLAFKDTDNPDEVDAFTFHEAKVPGLPHAGVLTSAMFLDRNPTTESNRNRRRSRMVLKLFLDTDILKVAQQPVDTTTTAFENPTLNDPQCQVCHKVIDPIAGTFKNWWDPVYENSEWYDDMRAPGFTETDLLPVSNSHASLQWLAQKIVQDPRFALVTSESEVF